MHGQGLNIMSHILSHKKQNSILCHAHTQPQSRFGSSSAIKLQAVVYNNGLWPAADAYLTSLHGSTPRPLSPVESLARKH
jgi:hypothetical protein